MSEKFDPALFKTVDPLLRLDDVCKATGLSPSEVYRQVTAGTFPRGKQLTKRCVAWQASRVQEWIDALPDASHHGAEEPPPARSSRKRAA